MPASTAQNTPTAAAGFALSHVGAVRKRNEDSVYVSESGIYALLADGMGGHRGGQEASRMAIRIMKNHFETWLKTGEADRQPVQHFFKEKFVDTSSQIYAEGQRNAELIHMGATLVAWVLLGKEVVVAHSGDSRAYLFRNGMLFQMTPDHTMENEHILAGRLRADVEKMPIKHVLSRNVGMMPPSEPDVLRFPALAGDLWLLCSDGLSNKLSAKQIAGHLSAGRDNLPKIAKKMVEHAFHAGGEDNITVCLMLLNGEKSKTAQVG
jgi:protein phosphatase